MKIKLSSFKKVCLLTNSASKDQMRITLNAVLIDFDKKEAVATDGHKMTLINIDCEGEGRILASCESLKILEKSFKSVPKNFPDLDIELERKSSELIIASCPFFTATFSDYTTFGTFPNYQAIWPNYKPALEIGLNLNYLKNIMDSTDFEKVPNFKLEFKDNSSPVILTHAASNTKALIMPVRL